MSKNYQLDSKDFKILAELDINARRSYNQIGKKVGLSKEVVKYRIDRLIQNKVIIRFHTIINYFKLGIIKFKLYLRLTNVTKEQIEEIGLYFQKHPKTEWVAVCTGRWDIIIGFLVNNVNEFDDEIQEVINKFSTYIQEKAVTITLYLAHNIREFLRKNSNKETLKIVYHTTKDKKEKIEKIEKEIIKIITNNARISITDAAQRLNITPRTIQYHLKELEKKKIILAYKAHIDPKTIGRIFCKAIIYLKNVNQKKLNSFINFASSLSGAIWPQRVIGNWDFELDFELKNYNEFQNMIMKLRENFPDVIKDYEFCILSKEYKLDLFPECYPQIKN